MSSSPAHHLPGTPSKRRRGGGAWCTTSLICLVVALVVLMALAIHNSLFLTARGYISSSLHVLEGSAGAIAARPAYPPQALQTAAPPLEAVPYTPSSQPIKPQQLQEKREKFVDALVCKVRAGFWLDAHGRSCMQRAGSSVDSCGPTWPCVLPAGLLQPSHESLRRRSACVPAQCFADPAQFLYRLRLLQCICGPLGEGPEL